MNGIWNVLGIAPTRDKRAVRAAYSAMAKQCHPEEDPQGFALLHDAYQEALAYAAGNVVRTGDAASFRYGAEKPGKTEEDVRTGHGHEKREESGEEGQPAVQEELQEDGRQDGKEPSLSLLERLSQAKEEEIEKSMHSGALMQFSAILNDPKKFRKADVWKAFFLSEDFLREQYQESFADGMLRILEGFHTEDNYSMVQMPSGFLLELAIAYALVLHSRRSEERAANFYAREVAASIWDMQQTQYSLPTGALGKPENQVRLRSFADYIRLREYHSRGLLTRQNQEDWKEFLHGGVVNYLYELKGKGRHEIYPGSRSVCLLDLYAFWIREEEDVPECVLEYIYKDYGLHGLQHTSTRKLYEPLKQAILARYPDIEEALYGEEGRAKMVSEWYKDMMRIISDNECFYEETKGTKERVRELFARKEWQKIRYLPELFGKLELQLFGRSVMPVSLAKRLMEFFADEEGLREQAWGKEQGEVMTEEMIHSLYYSRIIRDMHGNVPEVAPYFEDGILREVYRAEDHPEVGSGKVACSDTFHIDGDEECPDREDVIFCTDFYKGYPKVLYRQDFWHYFLMRGFGCRSARITGRGKFRREYMVGANASLPAYMEYLYQPSRRWQKLFTKDLGEEMLVSGEMPIPEFCRFFADDEGKIVPGVEFTLPDGKDFRAEFYLHYVRYYLDGEEIFRPVYDFAEYKSFAESISDTEGLVCSHRMPIQPLLAIPRTEGLILLLAVTRISAEDCEEAQEFARRLLAHLPLAPVSIPVIARLLVAGEEDETAGGKAPAGSYSHHISLERAAESKRYVGNRQEEEKTVNFLWDAKEEEGNRFCGMLYVEDEELCFRAVVREGGFSIFRQKDFGWEELHTAVFGRTECKNILLQENKLRMAREFLQGMKRPAPRLRASLSLEGMTDEKKAERILEALKQDALYRGHGLLPYAAGYPWEEKDTGRGKSAKGAGDTGTGLAEGGENALRRFYREYGGFLPECYCVLRFGENDTQVKKDHVFYASMKPFGFGLSFRALDWPSSYECREEELHRKVKEKHWAVGHFGWGGLTGPEGEALPKIVAVGESGTYYYYDIIRMMSQENLAALLAKMFNFSKVVAVESYEGELSISRFNGELEYCYGREAFLQSAYTKGKTAADLFTVFTKAEMMGEFAVYMDGLLGGITKEPESIYFEFSYVGNGAYAMQVFLRDAKPQEQRMEECGENGGVAWCPAWENLVQDLKPLVFKIWQQAGDGAQMSRDFKDTVYWYMECGKFGRKLAGWKKVTAGFDLGGGDELMVRLGHGKEEGWEWHRNRMPEREWEQEREREGDFEEEFEEEEFGEGDFSGEDWE